MVNSQIVGFGNGKEILKGRCKPLHLVALLVRVF